MKFWQRFTKIIPLTELRSYGEAGDVLENMKLLKASRLSVSPVTRKQWNFIKATFASYISPDQYPTKETFLAEDTLVKGASANPKVGSRAKGIRKNPFGKGPTAAASRALAGNQDGEANQSEGDDGLNGMDGGEEGNIGEDTEVQDESAELEDGQGNGDVEGQGGGQAGEGQDDDNPQAPAAAAAAVALTVPATAPGEELQATVQPGAQPMAQAEVQPVVQTFAFVPAPALNFA